jgi:hypothetical protein
MIPKVAILRKPDLRPPQAASAPGARPAEAQTAQANAAALPPAQEPLLTLTATEAGFRRITAP